MKAINKIFFLAFSIANMLLYSCEREDPMEKEQYIKQVYMVDSYQDVAVFPVRYDDEPQEAYVSVAVSGTLLPDQDVTATLVFNDNAISAYNDKYMRDAPVLYQRLPDSYFEMPSMSGTIIAGDIYSHIPFKVYTSNLHCDSLYALAFEIESVSAFQKNELTPTLLLNLELTNTYSGTYQLNAGKYTVTPTITDRPDTASLSIPSSLSASRTLKAVDATTVRFIHETNAEVRSGYDSNDAYWEGLKKYGLTFTENSDGLFSIEPWIPYNDADVTKSLNILAGECSYVDGVFTFWYDYMNGEKRSRIAGTLTKLK
ncbi:MAG: DUF1735 domain-containing protein [Mangrovibacterium sp.]